MPAHLLITILDTGMTRTLRHPMSARRRERLLSGMAWSAMVDPASWRSAGPISTSSRRLLCLGAFDSLPPHPPSATDRTTGCSTQLLLYLLLLFLEHSHRHDHDLRRNDLSQRAREPVQSQNLRCRAA